MSKQEQINCIRCRHCELRPETDMRLRRPVIYCGILKTRREINLLGCPVADPRPMIQNRRYTGGDKPRLSTPVERAFLKAHYPTAAWPYLIQIVQRDRLTIITLANRLGLRRGENTERRKEAAARTKQKRQERGEIFNQEQATYIEECFRRDFWPTKHFGKEPAKSHSEAIKAEIVAKVNALDKNGRVWEWRSIWAHTKWTSPSYKRDMAARNKRRRTYLQEWKAKQKAGR